MPTAAIWFHLQRYEIKHPFASNPPFFGNGTLTSDDIVQSHKQQHFSSAQTQISALSAYKLSWLFLCYLKQNYYFCTRLSTMLC